MNRLLLIAGAFLIAALIFAACSVAASPPPAANVGAAGENDDRVAENEDIVADEALASGDGAVPTLADEIITDSEPPPFGTRGWETDFSIRSVEWNEILSGGPPKDGIPAIDDPQFESVDAATEWLSDRDPIIFFEHNGIVKGYPQAILMWHEIVNDEVGGLPVAVTFCPLCNASIVFDRRVGDRVLDFGVSGKLRNSDLIMYDRQTESWWQQFTGEAIVGELTGTQLRFLPSQVISFGEFQEQFPDAQVLARPQRADSFARNYGTNPYTNYDSTSQPFLFAAQPDDRLPATERVVGVTSESDARAYPFSDVAEAQVINDTFDGRAIVIFHQPGMASALDTGDISQGKDVGSVAVFERTVDGQTLTFAPGEEEGTFVDEETGTVWNILGRGVEGTLAGEQLTEVLHFDHFWFAWAAFFPDTAIHD